MGGAQVALLGGGGFAIELAEFMLADGIKPIGYYALQEDAALSQLLPWLGDEREAAREDYSYIIATGQMALRRKMIDFLEEHRLQAASYISSRAYVSRLAELGKGTVIWPGAMVTGNPVAGNYLFMNVKATFGHHSHLGENVVMGPGVSLGGHVQVGNDVFFGIGSCAVPDMRIDDGAAVGAGSVVIGHVKPGSRVFGNPAEAF